MIYHAFSLYDLKAGFFAPPFFMAHKGQAIRAAMDLAQDLNTQVGRHPHDFALYVIGTYDDDTAAMTPCNPDSLGVVGSFLPVQDKFKLEP